MVKNRQTTGIAALLGAATIWGVSFVLAKVALAELPVAHVLLYRFVFAAVPFLPFLLKRSHRPARRDLGMFAITGFLMVPLTFALQFGALTLTSATSAALLVGTGAPLLALAAVFFEGERLGRRGWLSVVVSCIGVLLLAGMPGAGDDWRGNLMIFASMIVCTVWIILSKRLMTRYPALQATGWILLFGTLFLVPISLAWGGPPPLAVSAKVWAALAMLGLGCTTLAYVLWNLGVARVGAGRAGVYLNLEPIAGALAGVVLLGEAIGAGMVVGGTAILAAAGMVSIQSASRSGPVDRRVGSVVEAPRAIGGVGGIGVLRASAAARAGALWNWWLEGRPSLLAEDILLRPGRLASVGIEAKDHLPNSATRTCRMILEGIGPAVRASIGGARSSKGSPLEGAAAARNSRALDQVRRTHHLGDLTL